MNRTSVFHPLPLRGGTLRFSAQRSLIGPLPLRGRVGVGVVGCTTQPLPTALPPPLPEGGEPMGLPFGEDELFEVLKAEMSPPILAN